MPTYQKRTQGALGYDKPYFINWLIVSGSISRVLVSFVALWLLPQVLKLIVLDLLVSGYSCFLLLYLLAKLRCWKRAGRHCRRRRRSPTETDGQIPGENADEDEDDAADRSPTASEHDLAADLEDASDPGPVLISDALRTHQRTIVKTALALSFLYVACGLAYVMSLSRTPVSLNTCIYNCQCVVVFLLSVWLLGERVTRVKVVSVLLCLGGVVVISLTSAGGNDGGDGKSHGACR